MSDENDDKSIDDEAIEEIGKLIGDSITTVCTMMSEDGIDPESLSDDDWRSIVGDQPPKWWRDENGKVHIALQRDSEKN